MAIELRDDQHLGAQAVRAEIRGEQEVRVRKRGAGSDGSLFKPSASRRSPSIAP